MCSKRMHLIFLTGEMKNMTTDSNNKSTKRLSTLAAITLLTAYVAGSGAGCPKPSARSLEWGVLDKTSNLNVPIASDNSARIAPFHQYVVTLRVKDPDGIRSLAIWADGLFVCSTDSSRHGGAFWTAPNKLSAGVPKKQVTIPNAGDLQDFVMSDPFIYGQLSCGKHSYGGPPPTPGGEEYFVSSGALIFHGEETSWSGVKATATLKLDIR